MRGCLYSRTFKPAIIWEGACCVSGNLAPRVRRYHTSPYTKFEKIDNFDPPWRIPPLSQTAQNIVYILVIEPTHPVFATSSSLHFEKYGTVFNLMLSINSIGTFYKSQCSNYSCISHCKFHLWYQNNSLVGYCGWYEVLAKLETVCCCCWSSSLLDWLGGNKGGTCCPGSHGRRSELE